MSAPATALTLTRSGSARAFGSNLHCAWGERASKCLHICVASNEIHAVVAGTERLHHAIDRIATATTDAEDADGDR